MKTIKDQLINKLMKNGQKETSRKIVEEVIIKMGGWSMVENSINKIKPKIITRPMKKGATMYQVPVTLTEEKQIKMALKWLIEAARQRASRGIVEGLITELKDSNKEQGTAYKKKIENYKMALVNRAWLNYRW